MVHMSDRHCEGCVFPLSYVDSLTLPLSPTPLHLAPYLTLCQLLLYKRQGCGCVIGEERCLNDDLELQDSYK